MPESQLSSPDDAFLIAGLLGGDESALRALMDRYDRLVRYTVFRASAERCRRDPQWLESLATATWAGFVQSIRRDPNRRPSSIRAYLVRIARNKIAGELRRNGTDTLTFEGNVDSSTTEIPSLLNEPTELLLHLEQIEALRRCVSKLDPQAKSLMGQLTAIMERRWQDAAAALGLAESTLRSRWMKTLEHLRRCMARES